MSDGKMLMSLRVKLKACLDNQIPYKTACINSLSNIFLFVSKINPTQGLCSSFDAGWDLHLLSLSGKNNWKLLGESNELYSHIP